MNCLTAFKNEIFKYGIVASAIFELASLPFLGWDGRFFYGLLLGTAITIVNFNLTAITSRLTLELQKVVVTYLGYLIRLCIYGGTFYLSLRAGMISGLGTVLGFFTLKLAILYLYGIKAKFSKGRVVREEPEEWRPKKHWYDYKENDDYDD
jgi:hypothetical protein